MTDLTPVSQGHPDLLAAARRLLCDTVSVLQRTDRKFAIIGGWSPYLLNVGEIRHPGTRDVDVLFQDGETTGDLLDVVALLLAQGYLPSAKHEFQLLRVLSVNGFEFVFNVDLLHCRQGQATPDLFVDHVFLPVRVSEFSSESVAMASIVVPTSSFLFDGHVVMCDVHEPVSAEEQGEGRFVRVPLMDELGTLVTKAESMTSAKRRRDAFDILLAVYQARDISELTRSAHALKSTHPAAFAELTKLWGMDKPKLRDNVQSFLPGAPGLLDNMMSRLFALLSEAGVPRAESPG